MHMIMRKSLVDVLWAVEDAVLVFVPGEQDQLLRRMICLIFWARYKTLFVRGLWLLHGKLVWECSWFLPSCLQDMGHTAVLQDICWLLWVLVTVGWGEMCVCAWSFLVNSYVISSRIGAPRDMIGDDGLKLILPWCYVGFYLSGKNWIELCARNYIFCCL